MALNIIEARLDHSNWDARTSGKLWQYDWGQILHITGINLPAAYQIHFSNTPEEGTAARDVVSGEYVQIPDEYLVSGAPLYVFVVLNEGDADGETKYRISINVRKRPKPKDYEPTPEQQDIIDKAIAALNSAIERTNESAEAASASADDSEASAQASAASAERSRQYSEASAQSAEDAQASEDEAKAYVQRAETARDEAEQSASEAHQSEVNAEAAQRGAETAESNAQGFAQTATTKASEASQGASQAESARQTAVSKASEASASAQTASDAKDDAIAAKTDAETARTGAETAKAQAVTAKTDAETARDAVQASATQIETNKNDISDLKEDLNHLGYTTKTLLVEAGTGHSATADKIPFALETGEIFNITALTSTSGRITVRVYGFANAQDTTGAIISNSLALDVGNTVELTSNGAYEYIGLFWGATWQTITADVTFRIGREDSVFLEIEETTKRSQDNENRINNIESLTPNNIPYSTVAADWHSGTIDINTGENSGTSTKRIRLNGYINISGMDNINISTAVNVDCIVYFYDTTQTYLSATGWVNNSRATAPTGSEFIRVSLRYTDNTTISVNDVVNDLFSLTYNNPLLDAVEPIKDMPSYIYDTDDLTGKINIDAVRTAYANFANTYSGDIGEAFVFLTDPHPYYVTDAEMVKRFYATIAKALNQMPTGFVVSGGDWLTDGMTQAEACNALGYITAVMMRMTQGRFYPLLGNHDMNIFGNGEDPTLSYGAIITTMFPVQGKAYYHLNGANTSLYAIDTGSDHDTTMTAYRWTQMRWFAESLLHDTAEHIGILEHIYAVNTIDNVYTVASKVNQIITAFNARQTVDVNGVLYDYTTKTGRVEFVIAGHAHKEMNGYVNGIPVIVCDRSFTASIIGFDAILVNYTNRTINFLRTNTGAIRSISLDSN